MEVAQQIVFESLKHFTEVTWAVVQAIGLMISLMILSVIAMFVIYYICVFVAKSVAFIKNRKRQLIKLTVNLIKLALLPIYVAGLVITKCYDLLDRAKKSR